MFELNRVRAIALLTVVGLTSCYLDELTAPPADESSIEFGVSGDSIVLLGDSLQLSAAFDGGAGTGATRITWISQDTTVAKVHDASGMVFGVGAGVTEIAAYLVAPDLDNDLLRTWPMEVRYAGIGMMNDSLTGLGETRQLEARGLDVQGGLHEVVPAVFWSMDDSIITIDSSGVVVALKNGMATVNASWDVFATQAPILVRQVAGRVILGVQELKFPTLQRDTTISVVVRDTEDSIIVSPQITWASSNPSNISVTADGVIRGLQRGASLISVTSDTASVTLAAGVAQEVTTVAINDGNDQTAKVDTEIALAPSIIARDAAGNPVEGALVTFVVQSGGGRVIDSLQLTDATGVARVGGWVLGQTMGLNTLVATADTVSVVLQATGAPGPASPTNSAMSVSPDTVPSGANAILTLQGVDQFGNVVATGGQTITFSSSGGTSTGTISATTDNGDGTYSAAFTGQMAGSATSISAAVDGVGVATPPAMVTVIPGAPTQIEIAAGDNQSADLSTAVFTAPAVRLKDALNNPVPGVSVNFAISAGGGIVQGTPAISDANGVATVGGWTLGPNPGANSLTASVGSLVAIFSATGVAQGAWPGTSTVAVSVDTLEAGAISTLTLQSKDSTGANLAIGGYTVVFTHSGGTSTGTISATTDNGDGTYTAMFTGNMAGTATTIGASINGVTVSTPLPTVAVTPAAPSPATSLVSVSASSVASGSNVTLTLDTKDAFGNDVLVGGSTVAFSVSGGTSTGTVGSTTDNGDGTYTTTLTGQNAGTAIAVGATLNGASVTGTLPTVTVVPGPVSLASSTINVSVATLASGSISMLTVRARDAFGNDILSGGRTVAFSNTGGTSTGTIGATVDNGDGTYDAPFTGLLAGTATTINATIDAQAITSTPPTVVVVPGPTNGIAVVAGEGQSALAGSAVSVAPSVQVTDAAGNNISGAAVTFAVTAGGGGVTGSPATTDASGIATVGSWTLGTAGANTLDASISGLNVVFNATAVTAGASPGHSTVTVSVDTIQAGSVSVLTLQTKDSLGNDWTTGGATVTFGFSGGTSTGTIGATTDNGDGTYTASFTGNTSGTQTSIGATINGAAVTTGQPNVTVIPGPVSLATSFIDAVPDTVVAGNGATFTLTTKDAFGNDLTTGGKTVIFSTSGGTSSGTVGATTDLGDGKYEASFTGLVAGSSSAVSATIDGSAITSALPTVTVIPGAADPDFSTMAVSLSTLPSGSTSVITVQAKDSLGNNLTSGGNTVVISVSGGSSTGSLGATIDVGDGTYTADFVGQAAGSATTVSATLDGAPITTTAPAITVIVGPPGSVNSVTTATKDTLMADSTTLVTVNLKDDWGNDIVTGGATVTWNVKSGSSDGTFSPTIDNNDGTYSTTFSATKAGSPSELRPRVNGQNYDANLPEVTVIPGVPTNLTIIAGDDQNENVGQPVAVAPSVRVSDNHDNDVPGVTVNFTVTSGGGNVSPTSVVTGGSGVATVTSWTLGAAVGSNTLDASAPPIASLVTFDAFAGVALEETVTGAGDQLSLTMPTVAGGTNQTYVLFVNTENNEDITSVSGGGLTWIEQLEQCGGENKAGLRIWTAQGSPSAFQAVLNVANAKKQAAVLARYSDVVTIEGVAGNNNGGGSCAGDPPETNTPNVNLTSTGTGAMHLAGIGVEVEPVNSISAGYLLVGEDQASSSTRVFVYSRGFTAATSDTFTATLGAIKDWATGGIVLRPN